MTQQIQLNITHNPDMMSGDEAVSFYRDVVEGYVYPTPCLRIKKSELDSFITDIETQILKDETFEVFNFSTSKQSKHITYRSSIINMYASGSGLNIFVECSAKSQQLALDVHKIYSNYVDEGSDVEIYMNSFFMNDGRLDSSRNLIKHKDIRGISSSYYPYLDTDVMFQQFFTGSENIMLLAGAPGLGKSKMTTLAMKYAYQNPSYIPYDKQEDDDTEDQYVTCAYVKSIDVLTNDKFWRELEKMKADFCFIDDLDYMLTKRDAEVRSQDDHNKNVFLNQFLSYTDGIEKNKTKFIITTNQGFDSIDSALLRKGRLFDILEFRNLKNDEALNIWKESGLPESDFNKEFGEKDEFNPAELGSEISKRLNDRINCATKSYLKEDGISRVEKASRTKKIKL